MATQKTMIAPAAMTREVLDCRSRSASVGGKSHRQSAMNGRKSTKGLREFGSGFWVVNIALRNNHHSKGFVPRGTSGVEKEVGRAAGKTRTLFALTRKPAHRNHSHAHRLGSPRAHPRQDRYAAF